VRDALGWPTLQELGFDMPVRVADGTTYLTQLDQSIIQINSNNTWTRLMDGSVPQVLGFHAERTNAETVLLDWNVQGTEAALIEVYSPADSTVPTRLLMNLPTAGTTTTTLPADRATETRFVLWGVNHGPVYNPAGIVARIIQRELILSALTPPSPTSTQAAFQQYENGFMIWRADTGAVMVFSGSAGGQFLRFPENVYINWLNPDYATAPPGRIRPINAFGKVWNNVGAVSDLIGWAIGTEQAYTITIAYAGEGIPRTTYTTPSGRVVHVNHHQVWDFGG
jgi:hypothetical protein